MSLTLLKENSLSQSVQEAWTKKKHGFVPRDVKGSVSRNFLGPFLACMDRSRSV
jgi:hypothetical protein